MPMAVRTPRNPHVISEHGPYKRGLSVLDRKHTAVQRQLRRGGLAGYEPATQGTLLSLVELADKPATFFDVGAHIGLYSALVTLVFDADAVRTLAFEPTPETASYARLLRQRNGLDYDVVEKGLSSQEGAMTLYISEKAETSNSLVPGFRPSSRQVVVPVTTLDEFCRSQAETPTVIKVDVEMHEAQTLSGGLEMIRRDRPHIVCEMLPDLDTEAMARVLATLATEGYTLYHVDERTPWRPVQPGGHEPDLSHESRDWLMSPAPLADDFDQALSRWLQAISECTDDTNMTVTGGTPFPEGWDSLYTAS